ncbi:drainin [Dictyostelium purpureum]|uniref:Drainin n=1 Tax=Dictyostelium purpureum TaxID=5786 RepID=F0ZR88_DICPU|nr:drainin [Dictyostelium purpureum]EGC33543.1 drainin [Dictyostelium purpureum]|eukprot:XP_003289925.1 drainin [Dictyostelium purpureum]
MSGLNDNSLLPTNTTPPATNTEKDEQLPTAYKELVSTGRVEKLILSPTSLLERPSTLPPKTQEEILKHQKEYEKIQLKAKKTLEKEEKEKQRLDSLRKEKEKSLIEARKIWEDEIIPNWEKKKKDIRRIKEIAWRGLPPAVRGKVWKLCIGNDLRVTDELFNIFLGHANNAYNKTTSPELRNANYNNNNNRNQNIDLRQAHNSIQHTRSPMNMSSDGIGGDDVLDLETTNMNLILQDIQDTFPQLMIFQKNGPLHSDLIDVLGAYICYRPDIGYVPGMTFLAAMFLLNMDKVEAFICLTNHVNSVCFLPFFRQDPSGIPKYLNAMDSTVEALVPSLHKHFKEIGISAKNYLSDWITTLFSKALPLDIATRIWDLVFIEGEIFIYRTALSILRYFISDLQVANYDECIDLFNRLPQRKISEEKLFDEIHSIILDQKKFDKLLEK